jgi:GGDEF domain-containing protein
MSITALRDRPPGDVEQLAVLGLAWSQVERSRTSGNPLGLMLVDLGSQPDATCVGELSDVLGGALRRADTVAMVGAHTFCVLLPNCDERGVTVAETRIATGLAELDVLPGRVRPAAVSVGRAVFDPARPEALESVVSRAAASIIPR